MSIDPVAAARARLLVDAAVGGPTRLWRADAGMPGGDWQAALAGRAAPVIAARPAPSPTPARPAGIAPSLPGVAVASLAPAFAAASARTGVAAGTLAAIVGAEAARTPSGTLDPRSANPRSSARGLGQFLRATWLAEAARPGTALHAEAARRGWLDAAGRVRPEARASLLALRYDPRLAIEATADFAAANLARLGVRRGAAGEARLAWLAHHLGLGDAARYLGRGIGAARAGALLAAQIGAGAAARLIARAGDAAAAHRAWLEAYVRRKIG